jgi:uncharacterized protein
MKFHLTQTLNNLFKGYGPGYVQLNEERYEHNLVVLPDRIVPNWAENGFSGLTPEDFSRLLEYRPEIVVFGSGSRLRFPHPRLTAALSSAGVGLEVMDTPAACRTFNILIGEDRRALAAILLEHDPEQPPPSTPAA